LHPSCCSSYSSSDFSFSCSELLFRRKKSQQRRFFYEARAEPGNLPRWRGPAIIVGGFGSASAVLGLGPPPDRDVPSTSDPTPSPLSLSDLTAGARSPARVVGGHLRSRTGTLCALGSQRGAQRQPAQTVGDLQPLRVPVGAIASSSNTDER